MLHDFHCPRLKKKWVGAVLVLCLTVGGLGGPSAALAEGPTEADHVTLFFGKSDALVDGKSLTMPAQPALSAGRTFVPLRATTEAFGFRLDYAETDKRITMYYRDSKIVMHINQTVCQVNGRFLFMDVAPYLTEDGHTMVPVRFLTEAVGFKVETVTKNGHTDQVMFTR